VADRSDIPAEPPANPLAGMLAQVQQMQADVAAAQAALADATVEGSAGGGLVTATVSGSGELRSVHIAAEVVDPSDVEMLEDLVTAAVSDGLRRAHALQQEQMGSATGGLDLGSLTEGLGGFFGS
jgi:DNA-binding YbaB/EbfC family protein